MYGWLSNLTNWFLSKRRKNKLPRKLSTIEEQFVILTANRAILPLNKTLGDIIEQSFSSDELDKKIVGSPLINRNRLPKSTELKPSKNLAEPPTVEPTRRLLSKDVKVIYQKSSSSQINSLSNESILPGSPADFVCSGKKRNWFGLGSKKFHGKEKSGKEIVENLNQLKDDSLSAQSRTNRKTYNSIDQQISLHITPGGEVIPVVGHLSNVCESEKVIDGVTPVIVTHPPPELHRSSESLNDSLMFPKATPKSTDKRRLSAKLNVIKVAEDSRVTKAFPKPSKKGNIQTYSSIFAEKNAEASSTSHNLPDKANPIEMTVACRTRKPSIVIQHVPDKNMMNGERKNNPLNRVHSDRTTSELSTEDNPKNKKKKDKKKRNSSGKGPSEHRKKQAEVRATDAIESAESGKDLLKRPEGGRQSSGSSNGSGNSSWCRQICEHDKKVRYHLSKRSDCTCRCTRSRGSFPCRECRMKAAVISCPSRTLNHAVVRHISPTACNQGVSVLAKHADVVLEELIDRLAWEMADGILSRASYAKSLSCRSDRRTMMLLKALVGCRHGGSPDNSSTSMPFFTCSRRSSPLED